MGDSTRDRNQVEAARALLDLVFDTSTPCVTPSSQPAIAQPQPLTAGVSWPWRQLPRARTCRQPKLDSPQGAHLAHRKCHVLAGSSGWGTLSTAPSPCPLSPSRWVGRVFGSPVKGKAWVSLSTGTASGSPGWPCAPATEEPQLGVGSQPPLPGGAHIQAWEGSLVAPLLTWGWGPLHPPGPPGRVG